MKPVDIKTQVFADKIQRQVADSRLFAHVSLVRNGSFHVQTDVGSIAVDVFAVTKAADDHRIRLRSMDNSIDRSRTHPESRWRDIVRLLRDEVQHYRAALAAREEEAARNRAITAEINAIRDRAEKILHEVHALGKVTVEVMDYRRQTVRLMSDGVSVVCPLSRVMSMASAMVST